MRAKRPLVTMDFDVEWEWGESYERKLYRHAPRFMRRGSALDVFNRVMKDAFIDPIRETLNGKTLIFPITKSQN